MYFGGSQLGILKNMPRDQLLIDLMPLLLAGMQHSVLALESTKSGWRVCENVKGTQPQCVSFDPHNSSRAYCATYGDGIWRSDDNGKGWERAGEGIANPNVMAVSVSPHEHKSGLGIVYSGTEPSAFYRSEDGGDTWERKNALNDLESSKIWSFPPRPDTHHIRWIEPDVSERGHLFAAIEAGALVQSRDGGNTWMDRVDSGPYDTHTLVTHLKAPKRLYSSAGDGYFESFDSGLNWERISEGLSHHYLYGLAVDSAEPETVIASASRGAWRAHFIDGAESVIYRKSKEDERWRVITDGFPESSGTIITILASNPNVAGEFYAVNNRGIFCSSDSGISWERLDIMWPKAYLQEHPFGLAVRSYT